MEWGSDKYKMNAESTIYSQLNLQHSNTGGQLVKAEAYIITYVLFIGKKKHLLQPKG